MMMVMAITGNPMKHPATPMGIVNLELASNAADVQNILNAWDNDISQHRDVLAHARTNTWLDFIFIFFYSSLLYFLCKKLKRIYQAKSFLYNTGTFIGYAAIVAGVFDIVENIGMLLSLHGHITNFIALVTAIFSFAKWLLVLTAVLFIALSVFYKNYRQKNKQEGL